MESPVVTWGRWLMPAAAIAIAAYGGNFSRYTWWSWTMFTVYLAIWATGPRPQKRRPLKMVREWFFASNAVLVMLGVMVMSGMSQESSLLSRTNREYGSLVYGVGTFLLHYFPAVVTLSELDIKPRLAGYRFQIAVLAAAPGLSFTAYTAYENPVEVYGVPLSADTAMVMGAVYAIVAAGVAWWLVPASSV